MKNFVKAMNIKNAGFHYLKTKLLRISDGKLEEGTFVGPQIHEHITEKSNSSKLNKVEKDLGGCYKSTL